MTPTALMILLMIYKTYVFGIVLPVGGVAMVAGYIYLKKTCQGIDSYGHFINARQQGCRPFEDAYVTMATCCLQSRGDLSGCHRLPRPETRR